jgi:hypothetical protein
LHDPPVSHFAPFSKQRLDFPQQFCIAIAGRCQESNAFLRLPFPSSVEQLFIAAQRIAGHWIGPPWRCLDKTVSEPVRSMESEIRRWATSTAFQALGRWPVSSRVSHALAKAQSRPTVRGEILKTSAASSSMSPPKYRSSISFA